VIWIRIRFMRVMIQRKISMQTRIWTQGANRMRIRIQASLQQNFGALYYENIDSLSSFYSTVRDYNYMPLSLKQHEKIRKFV
jgi:hypothetical protein